MRSTNPNRSGKQHVISAQAGISGHRLDRGYQGRSSVQFRLDTAVEPRYDNEMSWEDNDAVEPRYDNEMSWGDNDAVEPRYDNEMSWEDNDAPGPRYDNVEMVAA